MAANLDALFADLHARGLFDGAVVVSDAGGVVFEKGYGDANASAQVPFTPDTAADGASLAKTMTAALLLALHHEGTLNLDDPAQKLLPELPYPEVTLRHLLSHSSGIPVLDYDYFDAYLPRDQVRTTETLLGVLGKQRPPLAAAPGSRFEYSSFGFDLAALAAARAAGKSYAELLAERFFRPAGISSAFVRPGRLADFPGVRTIGYRRAGSKVEPNEVFDFEAFHGGSNVYISARDLDRWNRSFMTGRLLTRATLEDVTTPASVGGSPSGLTLGSWYRSADLHRYWYSGHLQGFHDEVVRDLPANLSVVYVSNNTLDPWLQKAVVRAVFAVLAGEAWRPPVAPPAKAVERAERASLAGEWSLPNGRRFLITTSGGFPSAVVDGVGYRMVQVSAEMFYIPGLDWMVGFSGPAAGTFTHVYVGTNVEELVGRRVPA